MLAKRQIEWSRTIEKVDVGSTKEAEAAAADMQAAIKSVGS